MVLLHLFFLVLTDNNLAQAAFPRNAASPEEDCRLILIFLSQTNK